MVDSSCTVSKYYNLALILYYALRSCYFLRFCTFITDSLFDGFRRLESGSMM